MHWRRGLFVAVMVVWIFVLAVRCHLPRQTVSAEAGQDSASVAYVVQHGWHAGVAVPTADVPEGRWPILGAFSAPKYLEVGWGEAQYYPGTSRGVWGAFRAGGWPTGSVVHVVPIDQAVPNRFSGHTVVRVPVNAAELNALTAFIGASFAADSAGGTSPVASRYYADSRFYRSPLSYHVLNNCNHWAAAALEAAGCDVSPRWAFTVGQVMEQAEECGTLVQRGREP